MFSSLLYSYFLIHYSVFMPIVLYGSTEFDAALFSSDLYWRTHFGAPDPFVCVDMGKKVYVLVSNLELSRASKARGITAVPLEQYGWVPGQPAGVSAAEFLTAHKIQSVRVPSSTPYGFVAELEKKVNVSRAEDPVYPERIIKTAQEAAEIARVQGAVEKAILRARTILSKSKIKNGKLYWNGSPLTSEFLRGQIDESLYADGCFANGTIVAGGKQAADPHESGKGQLLAHQPIVVDVFPRSRESLYFADCTRTFFKGKPSSEMAKMYETVREAEEIGISFIKDGAPVERAYLAAKEHMESAGYPNFKSATGAEGFTHGLGHGVGIDIHEFPRIGSAPHKFKMGMCVTAEPGLYYAKKRKGIPVGGIRIEDIGMVTKNGFRNLTNLPKDLEWAVV